MRKNEQKNVHLGLVYSVLLTTLLFALSAEAVPSPRPAPITLSLTRPQPRTDIHPQILLQHHINRAESRLARMTGRAGPSAAELRDRLHRRALAIESSENVEREKIAHRNQARDDCDVVSQPQESPPPSVTSHLDIFGNGTGYTVTVQIGTPLRDFNLVVDSGSPDTWVGSENCYMQNSSNDCGNHTFLGYQSSSTFHNSGTRFNITYDEGAVNGTVITDDLTIAGLQLNGHMFGAADGQSSNFVVGTPDGLMGLSKRTFSSQKVPSPIEALANIGLIPAAITSYKLSRVTDKNDDSEITFGALDPSKYNPDTLITLQNVNSGFWEGTMDGVTVNGKDLKLSGRTAILDTGTTLMVAPADDATAVHNRIHGAKSNGQGRFTLPCTTTAQVALSFGGHSFMINPADLAFNKANPKHPNGTCISSISGSDSPTQWLLGDAFLKNVYFSTNVQTDEIKLAELSS